MLYQISKWVINEGGMISGIIIIILQQQKQYRKQQKWCKL